VIATTQPTPEIACDMWNLNHALQAATSTWHPVLKMYGTPSSTFLKGMIGWPIVLGGFPLGKMILISFHSSSGIWSMVQSSLLSFSFFWMKATH
jgi:hypothetical protein